MPKMETLEFERLVSDAIDTLPKEYQEKLDNVVVIIENEPTLEQLKRLHISARQTLFGLYQGVPKTRRSSNYTLTLPDKIILFQRPIEYFGADRQGIQEQIRKTLFHEIGHHFGLTEAELINKS